MKIQLSELIALSIDTGKIRENIGWQGKFTRSIAAVIAISVIYSNTISELGILTLTVLFLSQMLMMTFLSITPLSSTDPRSGIAIGDTLLAVASILCGIFFLFNAENIETRVALFEPLPTGHMIIGSILVLLTLEAMRRTVGLGLTGIVVIFMAYNLFGHLLPGVMGHGTITPNHFLDISQYTTDGLFGIPIRVAGSYVFLFVMFGTILARTGGSDLPPVTVPLSKLGFGFN